MSLRRRPLRKRLGDQRSRFLRCRRNERHDFTTDEALELHPNAFSENRESQRDRLRKVVKYDILVERFSGLTFDEAITKLRKRYRRMARENRFEDDEFYELFLDTSARSFGPHNRYLGERSLARFIL